MDTSHITGLRVRSDGIERADGIKRALAPHGGSCRSKGMASAADEARGGGEEGHAVRAA